MSNIIPKKHHGVIILASIVVLGALTYFLYKDNKSKYAKTIIAMNASQQPYAWLITLDTGYLKAWAQALQSVQTTFVYNGKTYNSQGGLAKQ